MLQRRRYRRTTVTVDVDIDDVIRDIDDETLLEALADRRIDPGVPVKEVERIYDRLKSGDTREAIEICQAVLRPKWASLAASEAALLKAKEAAT